MLQPMRVASRLPEHAGWVIPAALGLAFTACGWRDAPTPASTTGAPAIELSENPPPAGAVALGGLDVTHGQGCGVFGQDGTRAGIDHALRTAAARKRANYVQVVELVEPHMKRECFEHVFSAHALAFRVADRPLPERECTPPCSPGYACQNGACIPLCNPPCGADQVCRMDRTCGPKASGRTQAQP